MERKRVGDQWENWRAALVAHTVHAHLKGKRGKALKLQDFMPKEPYRPKPAQSWQEQLAVMERWEQALEGGGSRK